MCGGFPAGRSTTHEPSGVLGSGRQPTPLGVGDQVDSGPGRYRNGVCRASALSSCRSRRRFRSLGGCGGRLGRTRRRPSGVARPLSPSNWLPAANSSPASPPKVTTPGGSARSTPTTSPACSNSPKSMPASARALPLTNSRVPVAEELLREFLDAVADGMPRSPAAAKAHRTNLFTATAPQRADRLRTWADEVSAGLDTGVRISLRIELADSLAFSAVVQLHSLKDPTLVRDADDVWSDDVPGFGPRARIDATLAIRRAARVWQPLSRLLDSAVPDRMDLADEEVAELLAGFAQRLAAAGVDVHWPRSLGRETHRTRRDHISGRAAQRYPRLLRRRSHPRLQLAGCTRRRPADRGRAGPARGSHPAGRPAPGPVDADRSRARPQGPRTHPQTRHRHRRPRAPPSPAPPRSTAGRSPSHRPSGSTISAPRSLTPTAPTNRSKRRPVCRRPSATTSCAVCAGWPG